MALGQGANAVVEQQLTTLLGSIESDFGADALTYAGPIVSGADDRIKDAIETLRPRKSNLLFILETYGGYAEVARRISDTLRHHYRVVAFLVPSHAMSAGTILAMSGNSKFGHSSTPSKKTSQRRSQRQRMRATFGLGSRSTRTRSLSRHGALAIEAQKQDSPSSMISRSV
jgi:hypothetical protein